MNLPKPTGEATPEARDQAEAIATGFYLSPALLAMLWTLEARETGAPLTAEAQRVARSIAKHLATVDQRLAAIEQLAELGLVAMPDVTPTLTPWGLFVATVRRPVRRRAFAAVEMGVADG